MGNVMQHLKKSLPWCKHSRPEFRTVHIGNNIPSYFSSSQQKFISNRVTTSKYTIWNFVPKNLFEQFHRVANLYFLVIAIIQFTVDTPVPPFTSVVPLSIVIVTTAIKQGYEDWLRHRSDCEVNHREAHVLHGRSLQQIRSMEIQVGDIIKVLDGTCLPCDVVLLASSNPDGRCYITSVNLDGETNLKVFYSISNTRHMQTESSFELLSATIQCQQPIADLYRFFGRINIYRDDSTFDTVPLGPDNVLLRGARLKNTPFIYGCAIYTGQETKISLNSHVSSHKYSRVERKMNKLLVILLVLLVAYASIWIGLAVDFYSQASNSADRMWYTQHLMHDVHGSRGNEQASYGFQLFLGYMILCNNIIPISMYVSIEIQKFIGSKFFDWDLFMYNSETNEAAKARTSDLNEELGQVEYLFADKTGTLTRNEMLFRMCSYDGEIYHEMDGRLLQGSHQLETNVSQVLTLLISLALCHTVQVDGCGSSSSHAFQYQSSSPDEKALVEACSRLGVVYCGCQVDQIELAINGSGSHRYTRHHVLEFDATRKRMSVIVEDQSNGDIWLLCKGAETAIFERTVTGDIDTLEGHIDQFAKCGLRTLVIGRKKLKQDEFELYSNLLQSARNALGDRDAGLSNAYDIIENGLSLVGATAVEDQLQDGVPETLSALRCAGIQVWVLTGDRVETAINVSYSAGHFAPDSKQLSLTHLTSSSECIDTLRQLNTLLDAEYDEFDEVYRHNLVIDGVSLTFALRRDHRCLLRSVCARCAAVLCCRLTPIQKAEVVKLIKESPSRPTTAAIGDGANDVSMILEAHVGLAIYGKEGRQAVRASDYAFSQFSYLKRAFLVHGYLFYVRLSNLILYFFYKNIAVVLSQVYFTIYCAFSAQSLYDGYFLTLYNSVFTSIPILLYGLTEQNVPSKCLANNPYYYRTIRRNSRLSAWSFLCWSSLGVWHSVVLFFGAYLALNHGNSLFYNGKDIGVHDYGAIIMTACVIVVNIKLMLETYHFNVLIVASLIGTIVVYFFISLCYNAVLWRTIPNSLYGSLTTVLSSSTVWLLILFLVVASLLPDFIIRTLRDLTNPVYKYKHKKRKKQLPCAKDYITAVAFSRLSAARTISQTDLIQNSFSSS